MGLFDFIQFLRLPVFRWIQVEVSSFCNADCIYCPHSIYKDNWVERLMSLETYRKLIPAFQKTKLVYLQGWGEPFLNPLFFEMAAIAKKAGCRVGTSTNGMLLDSEKIKQLLDSGINLIAFSLAGTGPQNDLTRRGTRLDTVLDNINEINDLKKRYGRAVPAVHIAYLLLKSGLDEIKKLPDLVRGQGIDQVVISTLDFVPSDDLANEAIIPRDKAEYDEITGHLDNIVRRAAKYNVEVHYGLVRPGHRRFICTENVDHSLFVSSDGEISPCVFTNIPVDTKQGIIAGGNMSYKKTTFGNIRNRSLSAIWRSSEYRDFRDSFASMKAKQCCSNCAKLMIG